MGPLDVSTPAITVRLVGSDEDNGNVRFNDFRMFCDRIADCLRRAEAIVTNQAGRIRYRVVALQAGSAMMTLEAVAPKKGKDRRAEVVAFFRKTVGDLQVGTAVDARLTPDDLERFRDLRATLRKTKEVWIEDGQLTSQYLANIERLLGSSIASEGFVTGFLERLNVHNRNEFVLYPPIAGAYVVCHFPSEMFEQVRAAIKRNVTVSGRLFYHPEKRFPEKVHVLTLEIHPPDEQLPKLRDLRGLLQGCTNGVTVVEFIRAIRDEQTA